jgi:hypothetical protein
VADILKSILYLLSGVLILPGALLAYFFWTITGATKQKDLFAVIFFIFDHFIDLLMWALWFIIPALIIWLILAFIARFRIYGAGPMALLALVSLIAMFAAADPPKEAGELFIPVLSFAGLLINLWLVWNWMRPSLAVK